MAHNLEFAGRMTRLRAPVLAALILSLACNGSDSFTGNSTTDPAAIDEVSALAGATQTLSLASSSFAGGIPIGTFAQPTSAFGAHFNGALRTISPYNLRGELAAIKARGGKVVLMFAGNERHYKDGSRHFSITKWKARVARFKSINFGSYVSDGTIIAHYLIDEPNDPANWGGRPVSSSTVEEMAKYSKQLWPSMATVVRAEPRHMGRSHRYLDAAWAQYLHRRGNVGDYIARNVAEAKSRGLALIVGLNVLKGGSPNGTKMTASEVKSWGATLLSSSYPCAFISWQYNSAYLSSSSIKDAMKSLRSRAQGRAFKSCRG
jgi:hypothetical protein